jgi:hypothetical protein
MQQTKVTTCKERHHRIQCIDRRRDLFDLHRLSFSLRVQVRVDTHHRRRLIGADSDLKALVALVVQSFRRELKPRKTMSLNRKTRKRNQSRILKRQPACTVSDRRRRIGVKEESECLHLLANIGNLVKHGKWTDSAYKQFLQTHNIHIGLRWYKFRKSDDQWVRALDQKHFTKSRHIPFQDSQSTVSVCSFDTLPVRSND